jgi:hypothetical protein
MISAATDTAVRKLNAISGQQFGRLKSDLRREFAREAHQFGTGPDDDRPVWLD